jgi:hypothetical protein
VGWILKGNAGSLNLVRTYTPWVCGVMNVGQWWLSSFGKYINNNEVFAPVLKENPCSALFYDRRGRDRSIFVRVSVAADC